MEQQDLILGFWFVDAWDLERPDGTGPWFSDMWSTVAPRLSQGVHDDGSRNENMG